MVEPSVVWILRRYGVGSILENKDWVRCHVIVTIPFNLAKDEGNIFFNYSPDRNNKCSRIVIENFLWCVRVCNSSDDTDSSSKIGDKIWAIILMAIQGRDFGMVDSGSDDGGNGRHQGRQDCKEHTKRSK